MARPRGDHDERRRLIVRAACLLIARHGVDGATVRAVAEQLGVATKAVTHYFRSKDELLAMALGHIVDQQLRLSERAAGRFDSIDSLKRMLTSALPLNEPVRNGWRIWVAFAGRAVGDRSMQRIHHDRYEQLRGMVLRWLRQLAGNGVIAADRATAANADGLLALVDGIGIREAINPGSIPAARQRAMMAAAIGRLTAT